MHQEASEQSPEVNREEELVRYIAAVLGSAGASEDALPEFALEIKGMKELHSVLWGLRKMATSLSQGELDYICRERGFVIGALKGFQSNLRHLTWQAQRIASGEYHHRVNFLGDFSVAFNQMAEQLGNTIDQLTNMSEEYKDLSHRDPLTGLYNRLAFRKFSEQLLLKNVGLQQSSTLIMTDIDKFKNFNDTYGHLCGDEVLKQFSQKLLSGLRSRDLCARYGGEEFVILMPDTPLDIGLKIAERLRGAVESMTVTFEEKDLKVTSSFGVAEVKGMFEPEQFEEHMSACLQKADDNLYKAKEAGRNCVIG